MNPLRCRCVGNKLPIARGQVTVAQRENAIAAHRAAPQRTVVWPALRAYEQSFDETLGHQSVVSQEWQIDINQRIGGGETFPGRRNTTKAVNDPLFTAQEISVQS